MSNVAITNGIMRQHPDAVPLLDSIQILPAVKDKAIFIDTGLWNACTHTLLHELHRKGVTIDFRYSDNTLKAVESGYVIFKTLSDENKREVLKVLGEVEKIPYTMKNYVARHLLWEIPYLQVIRETRIFRGFDSGDETVIERGREIHPTVHWSKTDVVKFMQDRGISLTGDEFKSVGFNDDRIEDMVREAIEKRHIEKEFEQTKNNLKAWGYLD